MQIDIEYWLISRRLLNVQLPAVKIENVMLKYCLHFCPTKSIMLLG